MTLALAFADLKLAPGEVRDLGDLTIKTLGDAVRKSGKTAVSPPSASR